MYGLVLMFIVTSSLSQAQNSNYSNGILLESKFNNCPELPKECTTQSKEKLYILAMAPEKGKGVSWEGGPEVIPGALLAACHINCNATILNNYELELVTVDGGCNLDSKVYPSIIQTIIDPQGRSRNIVGVIGGGCSESAMAVGYLVGQDRLSLMQISPSATSPEFVSKKEKFPNTFRVTVSAQAYVVAFRKIIQKKKYKEVGILYESTRTYMLTVFTEFIKELKRYNIKTTKNYGFFPFYLEEPLMELKDKVRLVFVFASRKCSRSILCLAYRNDMLHPDYQFVFINRQLSDFEPEVTVEIDNRKLAYCNHLDMKKALLAATIFDFRATRDDKEMETISGYSYSEVESQYLKVRETYQQQRNIISSLETNYQNSYYDATWALALSLQAASERGVNLTNYGYGQLNATEIIREELVKTSFEGLSGTVHFNIESRDSNDTAIIDVIQYSNDSSGYDRTGYYDPTMYDSALGSAGLFVKNNIVFVDKSVFDLNIAHPPNALGYFFISVALVVILGIAVLHFINNYYLWSEITLKSVKASSPQLNNLIFSGCYLLLFAIIFNSMETIIVRMEFPVDSVPRVWYGVVCNAQTWVISLSFSLIFGTICVKTWRIYKIFSHFSSNPINFIEDNFLIAFVLCLVLIDSMYMIAWNLVNPLEMSVLENKRFAYRAVCKCDNLPYWLSFLLAYKALILALVVYLSVATRHIKREEFKQTRSINTLIYSLVIVNVFGIVIYVLSIATGTTELLPIISGYVSLCMGFFISVIICVVFIFLPPTFPLLRKKLKQFR